MAITELLRQKSLTNDKLDLEEISHVELGIEGGAPYLQIQSYRRNETQSGSQREHDNFAFIRLPDWNTVQNIISHIDIRQSSEDGRTFEINISGASGVFQHENQTELPIDFVKFHIEELRISFHCWDGDDWVGAVEVPIPEKVENSEIKDEKNLKDFKQLLTDLSKLQSTQPTSRISQSEVDKYDLFLSHSSRDKDDLVRPLYQELDKRGYKVWFDESELNTGDIILREIDGGLAASENGVVVLSPAFFDSDWAKTELYALLSIHVTYDDILIPIRHEMSIDEIRDHSPILASQLLSSTEGKTVTDIADDIEKEIST